MDISLVENLIEDYLFENGIIKEYFFLDVNMLGIGFLLEYDSWDNLFNFECGFNYKVEYLYFDEVIGSKVDYSSLKLIVFNYWCYIDKFNFVLCM